VTPVIYLHNDDNICVAARNLDKGDKIQVNGTTITLPQAVNIGHKIAIAEIGAQQRVLKYGQTIGFTTETV